VIGGIRVDADKMLSLETPEQSAEIAGVKLEASANRPDVGAIFADLPQHSRGTQRTASRQVLVAERAHALGDRPVEAPHLSHALVIHNL
jgi:hypothetical protein